MRKQENEPRISSEVRRSSGFTLMELIIVVAIISVLIGFLLPAIQMARESARRMQCRHQLRQLGIAVHSYLDVHSVLPPSLCFQSTDAAPNQGAWSIHGRLLPFMDQAAAYQQIHLELEWNHPLNQQTGIPQMKIPGLACPSDPHGGSIHYAGPSEGYVYPTNYGYNFGTWLVFDPQTNSGGDGCFYPNSRIRPAEITDGLSNTICVAEVKSYQPFILNTRSPGPLPPDSPSTPSQFARGAELIMGCSRDENEGHSEWCEGPVHQTGFTTVFAPNQFVPYCHSRSGRHDIDWTSRQEGTSSTQATYAAITARSYHAGTVNVLMMDGSVRSESDKIAIAVWRALGTRSGSE